MNEITIKEVWKDVKGFEGMYQVSNLGRVKSLLKWNGNSHIHKEYIKRSYINRAGYEVVELPKDCKRHIKTVHRLIAEAFIPNPHGYSEVNHIDSNPRNNDISNLEWVSHSWNIQHAYLFGKGQSLKDEYCEYARVYVESNKSTYEIAEQYGVSQSTVQKAVKRCGINSRKTADYNNKYHIPLTEMFEMFDRGMTNKEIANHFNCSSAIVRTRRYQRKRGII